MPNQSSLRFRHALAPTFALFLLLFITLCQPMRVLAQDQSSYDADRRQAFQLYRENKYTEALPLFEKLAAANPSDRDVIEVLGFIVFGQGIHLKDAAERKQARVRARSLLLRAQEMGADDPLLKSLLSSVPPDGGDDTVFSKRQEVDEAMRNGEEAFAKGELEKAFGFYQKALELDPNLYEAALFAGDVFYKSNQPEKAGEWFARAIQINPNRETAYRYWADVLMTQGKTTEARDKYVEAYITEPYNRLAASGFVRWADQKRVRLAHPKIDIPTNVSSNGQGQVNINLDEKTLKEGSGDGSAAWMMYGITRAAWMNKQNGLSEKFAKQYPSERAYRHSLAEEMDALRMVTTSVSQQMKDKKIKTLNPSLANLIKLNDAGLLEAYILLARADDGIAQDYAAYRKTNRDKLRRYVMEYVLTGGGQ